MKRKTRKQLESELEKLNLQIDESSRSIYDLIRTTCPEVFLSDAVKISNGKFMGVNLESTHPFVQGWKKYQQEKRAH